MTPAKLHEKIKKSYFKSIRKYRRKNGFPDAETIEDKYLINAIQEESLCCIELPSRDIKKLLQILEEYPRLKEDRDYLWNWQTGIIMMRNRAHEIFKDSRYSQAKKNSAVCRVFGVLTNKKHSKYSPSRINFEYSQLIHGYYCGKSKMDIEAIGADDAIKFLTKKHKFASLNARYQYLKTTLKIKGLPSTYSSNGVYK